MYTILGIIKFIVIFFFNQSIFFLETKSQFTSRLDFPIILLYLTTLLPAHISNRTISLKTARFLFPVLRRRGLESRTAGNRGLREFQHAVVYRHVLQRPLLLRNNMSRVPFNRYHGSPWTPRAKVNLK